MSSTLRSIPEMVAHVQAKAHADLEFRKAFLKDPRGTVELEFGFTMPEAAKVQAIEAPADTMVVVLPYLSVPGEDGALSDSDLESVAGGSKDDVANVFKKIGSAVGTVATVGLTVASDGAGAPVVGAVGGACFG